MIGVVFVGQVPIEIAVQPVQVSMELAMLPGRVGLLMEFAVYIAQLVMKLAMLFVELVMQAVVIPVIMRPSGRAQPEHAYQGQSQQCGFFSKT